MILDNLDIEIMILLQKDARMSFSKIAEKTGVSLPTVKNRVRKLRSLGVIKGFTVEIDPEKLIGGLTFFIGLKTKVSLMNKAIKDILRIEDVTGLYMTSGSFDLILKVSTPSFSGYQEFLRNKLSKIEGIETVNTFVVVKTLKEDYGPKLRPGLGVKVSCTYCGKEIKEEPLKLVVDDRELYFCCNSCLTLYKKEILPKENSFVQETL